MNDEGHTLAGYKVPDYSVDKCTIVSAVAYYEDGSKSEVKTKSYFVNFLNNDTIKNINVVSIVVSPDDLFDYERGIYVLGKKYEDNPQYNTWQWVDGNFRLRGSESERRASVEFFNKDRNLVYSMRGGIRVRGACSRSFAQKSLNLYARRENGNKYSIDYDFFNTGFRAKSLTFFNCGDDQISKSIDYIINNGCSNNIHFAKTHMIPYAMFLNGEYWGLCYLTEKVDKEYFEYYYNVNPDNVVMIKEGEIEEGKDVDAILWEEVESFIVNNDMTIEENYNKACSMIDLDSFIQYYASEYYVSNKDWPHRNYALWRTRKKGSGDYEDGKWRWIMYDLNSALSDSCCDTSYICNRDDVFNSLINNDDFQNSFYDALRGLSETYFNPKRMEVIIDELQNNMYTALKANCDRFFGYEKNSEILNILDNSRSFFRERYEYIQHRQNVFE